ncbi:MAG TPA: formyltransferase family protein [bacterium]|nr:formyltransferase family protein [bacterium]
MTRPLNIVLVAEEAAGVQTLRFLTAGPHRVVAVLTGRGHGDDGRPPTTVVGAAAARVGCPVWPGRLVRSAALAGTLRDLEIDLLLNVHSLFIVHGDVVAAPRIGSFNVHPGPLPAYAGLNVPSWAIYHGERAHAVTVHWMEAAVDTGPIAYQAAVDITESDTGYTLSAKCVRAAVPMLRELVSAAASGRGSIPRVSQADAPRRYCGRGAPNDGWLDWTAPARRVVDFVRAADYSPFQSPWGHPRTRVDGRELAVVRARRTALVADRPPGTVGSVADGSALVATGDEWVRVESVRQDGVLLEGSGALAPGERLTPVPPRV